jgi:hypothetical protein
MTKSEMIRQFIASSTCAVTSAEVKVATGFSNSVVQAVLVKMVRSGHLEREGEAGRQHSTDVYRYTRTGKEFKQRVYGQTKEEIRLKTNERHRANYCAKKALQPAKPKVRMMDTVKVMPVKPPKPEKAQPKLTRKAAKPMQCVRPAQSVDEWLKNGGVIESLGGLKSSETYTPRRPSISLF